MITRRRVLGHAATGAVVAGILPAAQTAFAAGRDVYNNPPPGVGPLIPADSAALKRFMRMRYGAFIHWGPSVLTGKEISFTRNRGVSPEEYDNLYKRFNPVLFDADTWIKTLKASGFRYLTWVPKHHDGFAMWDTKTTDYSIMNTPFKRDVTGEIAKACHKHGLSLCLYYSIADNYHPDSINSR